MKNLIFINLVLALNSFQLQGQQILHRNGIIAWNGTSAYYDNRKIAWNGFSAYFDNKIIAWNGNSAYHDNKQIAWNGNSAYYRNGQIAWNGNIAYYENGKAAWNGTSAYYANGKAVSAPLYTQIQHVNLSDLKVSELEISDKIKLLTKTMNKKLYVVGLKIQLSEKNSILINKENKLTINTIQLHKDIHFEAVNKKVKLSVLGQNVVDQK